MLMDWLISIHYDWFMADRRFWNDKKLKEQDAILCRHLSNERAAQKVGRK